MSQPAVAGGYVPQPGSQYDPVYAPQQQQYHQQPYYPPTAPAVPTAPTTGTSRSTLRRIVGFSTFLNAVGGLLVTVGAVVPIRRDTVGPFHVEYFFYTGRINGQSYPLGDALLVPYAIAMSLAITCGAIALLVALPIGIYDIRALSHQEEQPHQRRGCVRFFRTIMLLIAIKLGAMASLMAMFMTSVDYDVGDEYAYETFNASNLSEGFAMLVIGTILLGFADVLCVCHVIMAARVPQNGGIYYGDQQHLIPQQYAHPQHQYPQQQQQLQYQSAGTPTVYQGTPLGRDNDQYPHTITHPGNIQPNASYIYE